MTLMHSKSTAPRFRARLFFRLAPALCLLSLAACRPGEKTAATSHEPVTGLSAAGAQAGFAARLPQGTEFYVGSTGLKGWMEKLERSETARAFENYAKQQSGAAVPVAPTAPAAPAAPSTVPKPEDFFVSLGEGSSQSALWLKSVQELMDDLWLRQMVYDLSVKPGEPAQGGVPPMVTMLAKDHDLLLRVVLVLEKLNLPPLLAGVKLADADKQEADLKAKLQAIPGFSTLTATELKVEGGRMTLLEGTLGTWLTPETRAQMMERLRQVITDKLHGDRVEECLTKLAAKKISLAHGVVDGYLMTGIGVQARHLEFVARPYESLAGRPDFDFASKVAGEHLVGLVFVEGSLLRSLVKSQPVSQFFQNAIRAVKGSEALGGPLADLLKEVEPKVQTLAAAESAAAAKRKLQTMSAVVGWHEGLHVVARGGLLAEGMKLDQSRQFGGLLDYPGAVIASVGASPVNKEGRAVFESATSTLSSLVMGLAKLGVAGEQAGGVAAMAQQLPLLDGIASIYEGFKGVMDQGLGAEGAFVMDLSGQFPGLTPENGPKNSGIPRLAWVQEVVSRPAVGEGWGKIESSVEGLLKAWPTPIPLPKPVGQEQNGMKTWAYQLTPMPMQDLLPCATLDNKVCVWGTSRTLNESLLAATRQPGTPVTGAHFRINIPTFRQWMQTAAQTASNIPTAGKTPGELMKAGNLLNNFGVLQVSTQASGEVVQWTLDLQVR